MAGAIQKVKRVIKCAMGKDFFPKLDIHRPTERLGSVYGGWDVILGRLNKGSVVYSFGVGEDVSFDIALIDKYGLIVNAFDPTPKSIAWVRQQKFSANFRLHEYGVADFDGEVTFFAPDNDAHISHSIIDKQSKNKKSFQVSVKRLSTVMTELGHRHVDLLKMDVEGAEYGVIDDIEKSNIRPDQILVEFHHRFPGVGLRKTKEAIEKLRAMGYALFAVSDTGEEFCFTKNS
jgi:FkbM family methyltransferase